MNGQPGLSKDFALFSQRFLKKSAQFLQQNFSVTVKHPHL